MAEKGWESQEFADAWKKRAGERRGLMAEMTEAMFEAAGVKPGARVLDLGTGTGDTALLAAERVGAGGSVVATDASPSMVEAAREAVAEAGAKNVSVQQVDAAALEVEVEAGAFDAVIGRQVLMFVDRAKTFAGVLRALRPGGKLGACVWGPIEENEFHGRTIEAARAKMPGGTWGEEVPQMARAFAINERGIWVRWLKEAGFVEVKEREVRGERKYASPAEAFKAMRESPIHAEPVGRLGEREQEEVWKEMERLCEERGGVFPTLHLVVEGRKAGG